MLRPSIEPVVAEAQAGYARTANSSVVANSKKTRVAVFFTALSTPPSKRLRILQAG